MFGPSRLQQLLAEFAGTFATSVTSAVTASAGSSLFLAKAAMGCSTAACTWALGAISGANLNSATTLALGLTKKLPWSKAIMYLGVQLAGGFCARLACSALFSVNGPSSGMGSSRQAGFIEMLYSGMASFVLLNVACSRTTSGNEYYGLAFGAALFAGSCSAAPISGGFLNTYAALTTLPLERCGLYALSHIAGGVLAAKLFMVCRAQEDCEEDDFRGQDWMVPKLASEFTGTYFVALTAGLSLAEGGYHAVPVAAAMTALTYALGNVSGANFNPGTTLAMVGQGYVSVRDGMMYVATQLLASAVAGLTVRSLTVSPASVLGASQGGCAAEALFTLISEFTRLSVVAGGPTRLGSFFGLAVGSSYLAGASAAAPFSSGLLNPAICVMLACAGSGSVGRLCLCALGQLAAEIGAVFLFKFFQPKEDRDDGRA